MGWTNMRILYERNDGNCLMIVADSYFATDAGESSCGKSKADHDVVELQAQFW